MVDRPDGGERLAHRRLVCDIEGDALGVDVGALGISAEDHDVPAGVHGQAPAASPMPEEPPTNAALMRSSSQNGPASR